MTRIIQLISVMIILLTAMSAEAVTVELKLIPNPPPYPQQVVSLLKGLRAVRVLPFVDQRKAGENVFGELRYAGEFQKLMSSNPVADYVTASFKKIHSEAGGKVSDNAPLLFKGEITQFYLDESDGGQARVGFHFYLGESSGKILWDGHSTGIVKGGSRILSPETASALISDVLRATYLELLEDDRLIKAWSASGAGSK